MNHAALPRPSRARSLTRACGDEPADRDAISGLIGAATHAGAQQPNRPFTPQTIHSAHAGVNRSLTTAVRGPSPRPKHGEDEPLDVLNEVNRSVMHPRMRGWTGQNRVCAALRWRLVRTCGKEPRLPFNRLYAGWFTRRSRDESTSRTHPRMRDETAFRHTRQADLTRNSPAGGPGQKERRRHALTTDWKYDCTRSTSAKSGSLKLPEHEFEYAPGDVDAQDAVPLSTRNRLRITPRRPRRNKPGTSRDDDARKDIFQNL